MRIRTSGGTLAAVLAAILGLALSAIAADKQMRLQALLVWGTSANPPSNSHKPVEPELARKLQTSFKWSNYFEVNRTDFVVPNSGIVNVPVSAKCAIEVKRIAKSTLEVGYIGKGKPVERRIIEITKGNPLIYGGNAPNSNAWFVVLKRLD